MEESKKWYLSKTLWVGALEFLIGAGMVVSAFFAAGNYSSESITLMVVGILTVGLRLITSQPLE